jgi:uncharacterized membrane protein YdjX (TVP38/TMEM64 family)
VTLAERLHALAQAWEAAGFLGLCMLALAFALGALTFMPRFTFYAIGGLVFGLAAIPAAIAGSTIGCTIAFLLARTVLRAPFRRLVDRRPAWQATLDAVDAEGWRIVALTRLASPLPGGMINYVYGLTGIALAPYIAATAGGLVAPVTLFASIGALGRLTLEDQPGGQAAAFAAGMAVLALAVILIVRRRRADLSQRR